MVSHPCVVTCNQEVYARLLRLGWDLTLALPAAWKDDYNPRGFTTKVLPELEGRVRLLPVLGAGEAQRHVYRAAVGRLVRELRPEIAFLEQEPFSVPCLQWGVPLRRARVPIGVQADENLDRDFSLPARMIRRWSLPRVRFIAARSPAAGEISRRWGYRGALEVVPHTVPDFELEPRSPSGPFTVGFAGRLIPEKGVDDLVDAVRRLEGPIRLLMAGDGPLREKLAAVELPNGEVEVRTGLSTTQMPSAYRDMDVLVLPSRTTATWAEQFGRVLVEGMLCGRPVIGSDSGEIPWVIRSTGGGLVFPEGDVDALTNHLRRLQRDDELRAGLARRGREGSRRLFSLDTAAGALDALLLAAAAPPARTA